MFASHQTPTALRLPAPATATRDRGAYALLAEDSSRHGRSDPPSDGVEIVVSVFKEQASTATRGFYRGIAQGSGQELTTTGSSASEREARVQAVMTRAFSAILSAPHNYVGMVVQATVLRQITSGINGEPRTILVGESTLPSRPISNDRRTIIDIRKGLTEQTIGLVHRWAQGSPVVM